MQEIIFFWKVDGPYSCFCNWSKHQITDEINTYKTAEHYLMYHKAILMGDSKSAEAILNL